MEKVRARSGREASLGCGFKACPRGGGAHVAAIGWHWFCRIPFLDSFGIRQVILTPLIFTWNRLFFVTDIIQYAIQTIAFRKITRFIFQCRLNRIRHNFTQLNAELVKRIDIPDHTLNKHLMLIQGQ